jgi:hypothetical protein
MPGSVAAAHHVNGNHLAVSVILIGKSHLFFRAVGTRASDAT